MNLTANVALLFITLLIFTAPCLANDNTATGAGALSAVTTGTDNTVLGTESGSLITTGTHNVIAGEDGNITTGSNNLLFGNSLTQTTSTGSNQLDIGDTIYGNLEGATGGTTLNIGTAADTGTTLSVLGVGSMAVPVGTTAQRPSSTVNGQIRYNSSTAQLEAYINGSWTNLVSGGGRTRLTASTNFYVATTGSDSNDGTSGSPWLTIQHAIDYIQQNYDLAGYTATVNVADGTYAENVTFNAPFVGGGTFSLLGDTTTPANCVIAPSSGGAINVGGGTQVTLGGFNLEVTGTNTTTALFVNGSGTVVNITNPMYFGGSHAAYTQIYAYNSGNINISANITFASAASNNLEAANEGVVLVGGITMTLSGSPSITDYYYALNSGLINAYSITFAGSGTVTNKYSAVANGLVQTNGACSSIPGSSTVTATQGQCL